MCNHPGAYNPRLNCGMSASRVRYAHTAGSAGFTLVELVSVLVLIGILSAITAPRISTSLAHFHQRFMYDETVSALRYARNRAIARQCNYGVRLGTEVTSTRGLRATDGVVVVTSRTPDTVISAAPACVTTDLRVLRSAVPRPNSRESEGAGGGKNSPFFLANENNISLPNKVVGFDPLGRPYTGANLNSDSSSKIDGSDFELCVGGRKIIIRQNSGLIETSTVSCRN